MQLKCFYSGFSIQVPYIFKIGAYAVLFVLVFCTSAVASPMQATEKFIDAMKQAEKGNPASYAAVDTFINYDLITSETIKPHLSAFKPEEVKTFKKLLTEIIRLVAYPRSAKFYTDASYNYQPQAENNGTVKILSDMKIEKEDFELQLGYFWQQFGNNWMIVDLSFDDDSIVKDYQNQFGRIISKEGVAGLLKKLEEKLTEVRNEK